MSLHEQWTAVFIPLNESSGLSHVQYTWGSTYVLEMLAALYPRKHFVLLDNDAAPTTLWEVADFQRLCARVHKVDHNALCHVISEHASYLNAGIMIFPCSYS